jgi:hypothetical protein
MKEEPDIKAVTQEASLLVSKAVELFVEALTAQALACSPADTVVRSGLAYTDVGACSFFSASRTIPADAHVRTGGCLSTAAAVSEDERLDFLRDIVPLKVLAATVVEGRPSTQ